MKYEKTINVNAHGSGDVVAGNKQVKNDVNIESLICNIQLAGVSLEQIKRPLETALNEFRDNKTSVALMRLEMASQFSGLNEDALLAISSLRILLSENQRQSEDEERIRAKVGQPSISEFAKDLVEAAFLKVLHLELGEERAVKWYQSVTDKGEHLSYVYLQRFASEHDVLALAAQKETLPVATLHALFSKALDYLLYEVAGGILDQLQTVQPLGDFERYEILLDCVNAKLFATKDYFLLTNTDKLEFDRLRDTLIKLVDEGETIDFRILHVLVQVFQFTQYSCVEILNCLERFEQQLEEKNYYENAALEPLLTQSDKHAFARLKELEPEEIMLELIRQTDDDFCNFAACKLLFDCGDEDLIIGTLKRLSELDSMGAKVNFIALAAISSPLLKPQDFPYMEINDLFEGRFKDTPLSSTFVDRIGIELATHGQPELAVSFYNLVFENTSPWLSAPYLSYLKLLFQTRQYKAISECISALTEEERQTSEILTLCSYLASKDNNYELAASLIKKNIDSYNDSLCELDAYERRELVYLWGQYLSYVKIDDPKKAESLTNDVPKVVLDSFHDLYSWRLVSFFLHRLEDVAERMLDWFFRDPYRYAKDFFAVYFQACQYQKQPVLPPCMGKYKSAYAYRENQQSHIKVTVPRSYKQGCPQYLIEQGGDIANKLESAQVGDAILLSVKLCTLESKLNPLQAASTIARRIMDQDEQEIFYEITLPEDASGQDILVEIEKCTAPMFEYLDQLKPIMKTTKFPIDMKFGELNGTDVVVKALIAILDSNVRFMVTLDDEVVQTHDCDEFVLTEITALYLACLGGDVFPDCNWLMTEPVFNTLNFYSENYQGRVPVYDHDHRTVYFHDIDNVEGNPTELFKNLKAILARTTVHSDRDLDIPLDLKRKFRHLLKDDFLLSLSLAEQLGVGLFCIDANTRIVIRTFGYADVPLRPVNFDSTIIESDDRSVFSNAVWLNSLSCRSSLSYKGIVELLNKPVNEDLKRLICLFKERTDVVWDQDWHLTLLLVCLETIIQQRIDLNDTDQHELILLEMLKAYTKSESLSEEKINGLVQCSPVSRLLDRYASSVPVSKKLNRIFIDVTDCYMQALSKAVSHNHHPLSSFWKAFSEACN